MYYALKDTHGEYIHQSSKFWGTSRVIYTSDIESAFLFLTKTDAHKALVRVNNLFKKQEKEIAETGSIKNYRMPVSYNNAGVKCARNFAEVDIIKLTLVESSQ